MIQQLTAETRTAGAVVTTEELAELKANSDFLSKATPAEIKQRAKDRGLKELASQGLDTSEEGMATLTDAIWQALPSAYKGKVKAKGGLLEKAYNPDTDDFGPPNDSRGKQILRQFLDQNGRDAYTGLPIGLRTSDLEHIVPIEKSGLDGDRPDNHVLTSAAVNQWKSAKDLGAWLADDVSKRTDEDVAKSQAKAAAKKAAKNAAEDTMGEVDVKSIADPSEYVDKLGKNYHTLGKLTGVSMSYRFTRPATGKVGSAKLGQEQGAQLQKAALAAMKSDDKAALDKVMQVRDEIAKLARANSEKQLSDSDFAEQAKKALAQL